MKWNKIIRLLWRKNYNAATLNCVLWT